MGLRDHYKSAWIKGVMPRLSHLWKKRRETTHPEEPGIKHYGDTPVEEVHRSERNIVDRHNSGLKFYEHRGAEKQSDALPPESKLVTKTGGIAR